MGLSFAEALLENGARVTLLDVVRSALPRKPRG